MMGCNASKMGKGVQDGESGLTIFVSDNNGVGVNAISGHIMERFDDVHRLSIGVVYPMNQF